MTTTPAPGPIDTDDPVASRVAIVTLGCGRNEVDSDQLAGLLGAHHQVVDDATTADVVLVNTCTFIEPAKQESVDTILAAADLKDPARGDDASGARSARGVVVIGCMAQRYPRELSESLPEADAIVGFAGYPRLPGLVDDILAGRRHDRVIGVEASTAPSVLPGRALPVVSVTSGPDTEPGTGTDTGADDGADHRTDQGGAARWMAAVPEAVGTADATSIIDPLAVPVAATADRDGLATADQAPASGPLFPPRRAADGTWAYLKIASGCDRLCTFCAIPSFRGRFRSRGIDELVAEATWLAGQGTRELVLVSENTTSWGKDLGQWRGHPGGRDLAPHLLQALADVDGIERIRLMYLQPAELRPDLLEAMVRIDEVVDYFDLSLQHVSAPVLRAMARSGSPDRFGALLERIRELSPDAAVRSNFILGFPGEEESHVEELMAFLDTHELDFVGLFTYSDEDGTPAVDLADHVPADVATRRRDRVAEVVERASDRRARRRVGDRVRVLVEQARSDGATTEVVGRSHREAPEADGEVVLVDGDGRPAAVAVGDLVEVEVVDTLGVDLVGRVG